MTVTRADVVAEAMTWLGTPWKHQAMLKGVGTNCIGYLAGVALELRLADARDKMRNPRFRGYGREPLPDVLLAACEEYLDEIDPSTAGLGDILLLKVPRGVQPQHFGVVSRVTDGKPSHMLHATAASPRKVVENGLDAAWSSRIVKAYRFRGVA
jgi:NlpC/P60 family putative phage cell wall peptidase